MVRGRIRSKRAEAAPVPLTVWLRRQRRRRWLVGGLALAALVALLVWRDVTMDDPVLRWTGRKLRVIEVPGPVALRLRPVPDSGDAGSSVPIDVRLLGVRAPDGWSQRCRAALREAARGQTVTLSFYAQQKQQRDAAGRLLCYVYLADGRMLNEWLIRRGLARCDRSRTHALTDWLRRLERRARRRQRGRWAAEAPTRAAGPAGPADQ